MTHKEWKEWFNINKSTLEDYNITFRLSDRFEEFELVPPEYSWDDDDDNIITISMDGIVGDNYIDFKFETEFKLNEDDMIFRTLEFLKETVIYKRKMVEDL